jgi:hypothetical protein
MAARYTVGDDSFHAEKSRVWSERRVASSGSAVFDLHPDGDRVAIAPVTETLPGAKQDHVTLIFNFFDELRRIAPVTKR